TRYGPEVWHFVGLGMHTLDEPSVTRFQDLLAHLIGVVIERGVPMHKMTERLTPGTFQEMNRQALNSEHGLLWAHTLRAERTGCRSQIPVLTDPEWSSARWRRLLPVDFFRRVDCSHTDLSGADLSGTDLTGVNLSGADLTAAILFEVNLSGA